MSNSIGGGICKNPTILGHCKVGIERVSKLGSSGEDSAGGSTSSESGGSSGEAKNELSDFEKVREQKKADVMKQAQIDIQKIRDELKERLSDEDAENGRRYRNRQTGERSFHISGEAKAEITREYEERIRKVREDAERKAASYK